MVVSYVAFRRATGSRLPGWGGRQPGGSFPTDHNLFKVGGFRGQSQLSLYGFPGYSIFKPRPQLTIKRWPGQHREVTTDVLLYSSLHSNSLSHLDYSHAYTLLTCTGMVHGKRAV